jgi:uncharacterized protein YjbI with pentapeptide repeats
MPRLSYEDSCRKLQGTYLDPGKIPPRRDHVPQIDDPEPLGVSFFRTRVMGDLSNLTLPRTFFGRSEVTKATFRNADLMQSNLAWNDFIDTDFSSAVLAGADLRASQYVRVSFADADLTNADLRRSSFESCDFSRTKMLGARLTRAQGASLVLSEAQRTEIEWTTDGGPEPNGG